MDTLPVGKTRSPKSEELIDGLQPIPWDSKHNVTAAMLISNTVEVNEILC